MPTRTKEEVLEIATAIAALVTDIEGRIETTQGHYGDYMSVISRVAGDDRAQAILIATTLKAAGANAFGVDAALRQVIG